MEDNKPIDVNPSKFVELKAEINLADDLRALFARTQGNAMEASLNTASKMSIKKD